MNYQFTEYELSITRVWIINYLSMKHLSTWTGTHRVILLPAHKVLCTPLAWEREREVKKIKKLRRGLIYRRYFADLLWPKMKISEDRELRRGLLLYTDPFCQQQYVSCPGQQTRRNKKGKLRYTAIAKIYFRRYSVKADEQIAYIYCKAGQ